MAPPLRGIAVLVGCWLFGEGLTLALHLPLPGAVVGMLLLTAVLASGRVTLATIKPVADGLLRHLALLFVPTAVGLMLHFDLLRGQWRALVVAVVVGTLITLAVAGWLYQRLEKPR